MSDTYYCGHFIGSHHTCAYYEENGKSRTECDHFDNPFVCPHFDDYLGTLQKHRE